ncbi:heterokaryon incompatibility protein-domain-containing protein [Diplogelasinospora grovesii]|uniref:Heterokaryon incompatibility protein-domain-containing protein n=1 Tax=Diplogelasinospora grovesii TaxID=303347 RepID=A0AAN6S0J6_9PEZI|nr:heterokaryon incompatibility protein-domain-containing protein [Diplogelasinospora grovesii]
MDLTPSSDLICSTCNGIAAMGGTGETLRSMKEVPPESVRRSAAAGCEGCRLILHTIQSYLIDGDVLRRIVCGITKEGVLGVNGIILRRRGEDPFEAYSECMHWLYPYATKGTPWAAIPVAALELPRLPTFEAAIPQIQSWLAKCAPEHSACATAGCSSTKLPTRVIDVGDSCTRPPRLYVPGEGEEGRYIALSYRWGPSSMRRLMTTLDNMSSHCAGIALERFPRTYRDAIRVARALGFRYLWIDSLCIVQDSLEDWTRQSSRMADIYRNARLTLAAEWGDSSDAGLFVTDASLGPTVRAFTEVDSTGTPHRIYVKRWSTVMKTGPCYAPELQSALRLRGWTLQERMLSRRVVLFTNAELIWECDELRECSCGKRLYSRDVALRSKADFDRLIRCGSDEPDLALFRYVWHRIVLTFTDRELSFTRDRLPALAGIASLMPLSSERYLAGLWLDCLEHDLLWVNSHGEWKAEVTYLEDGSREVEQGTEGVNCRMSGNGYYAPSWSWASVCFPVHYQLHEDWGPLVPEWEVKGARCLPATENPYGPVSEAVLEVEGYLVPVTFGERDVPEPDLERVWRHLCLVREHEKYEAMDHIDRDWIHLDAMYAGREWKSESHDYYVLVAGYRPELNNAPDGLILRQDKNAVGDSQKATYARIGFVRLLTWAESDWKAGAQRRAIVIV